MIAKGCMSWQWAFFIMAAAWAIAMIILFLMFTARPGQHRP